jgi:hypothetical protein
LRDVLGIQLDAAHPPENEGVQRLEQLTVQGLDRLAVAARDRRHVDHHLGV